MKIRDYLKTEDQWVKGTLAVTKAGKSSTVSHPETHRRCLLGWVRFCYDIPSEQQKILKQIAEFICPTQSFDKDVRRNLALLDWNDANEFEDIKNLVETLDI